MKRFILTMAMTCAAVTGMQADGVESLRRNQVIPELWKIKSESALL